MTILTTVSPENLKTDIPDIKLQPDLFIAGGAIRDSILGIPYDDIDVFGPEESLKKQQKILESRGYKIVYDTEKLATLKKDKIKIQLISRKDTETIESCLNQFDFTICQFAYDPTDNELYCNPDGLIHLFEKRLVLNTEGFPFPLDTMRRLQKYIQKGYTICNGGIKELADAIRGMSDEDLKEQVEFYPDKSLRIMRWD